MEVRVGFDLAYISPELILSIGGILAILVGLGARSMLMPKRLGIFSPEAFSLIVLAAAFVPTIMLLKDPVALHGIAQFVTGQEKYGLLAVDGLAIFFKIIALVSTGIVILMSIDYFRGTSFHRGEYYALLIFAALAITVLAASTDMIMIYLSLEFLSITSYILTGYLKKNVRSNEAALKYFIYGSVAAAVMIYGMSILYGITGTTNILVIAEKAHAHALSGPLLYLSTLLILIGFGFKIALVPAHQWAPDVYEGAPTPITAFLSVGSKAAGFAVLVRFLGTSVTAADAFNWVPLIVILSGLTMTIGNLTALPQRNIKRMLAYSSIAQAGYLLLGVAALGSAVDPAARQLAIQSILLYLLVYLFMNLGAFAVVTLLGMRLKSDNIEDYGGLVKRAPWAAVSMLFFMLSLAGIPPTAGFLGKFYLFLAAIKIAQQPGGSALLWLSVVAIINTVVSVYYYFNVVREMFFGEEKQTTPLFSTPALNAVIGVALIMTVLVLVFSQTFGLFTQSTSSMLSGL